MFSREVEIEQREFCREYKADFVPCGPDLKVGIALQTLGMFPINGLRHPQQGDTSGWYIWAGNELSEKEDFFEPLHTKHLMEKCPKIVKFLGLPPGYRFLVAGEYVDIWFDEKLLKISSNE